MYAAEQRRGTWQSLQGAAPYCMPSCLEKTANCPRVALQHTLQFSDLPVGIQCTFLHLKIQSTPHKANGTVKRTALY